MKPTFLQLFFAEGWPSIIWVASFVTLGVMFICIPLLPTVTESQSFWTYGQFVILLLAVGAISYFAAFIIGSLILPPFFRKREELNGSPFFEGDLVEILKKPHRGTQAIVYDVWQSRFELRLELGITEKENFTDLFSYTEVRKIK